MKFALGFIVAVVVIAVGAAITALFYDVAASAPEPEAVSSILHSVMRHSVQARAAAAGRESWSPAELQKGFEEYDEMCVICHSAPGKERTPISKGLQPQPPDLAKASTQWTTAQLFWIISNGVRMTGMPAFGRTHGDAEIWNIVGFVRLLPKIPAQTYRDMESRAAATRREEETRHGRP
ncbi:cytochrome c [Methylocystis sp. IM3]|uniref:c-type cytochrome n=1 Tax=unclassified Methylocystis TaxID=2625913 RepID=UPI00311A744D